MWAGTILTHIIYRQCARIYTFLSYNSPWRVNRTWVPRQEAPRLLSKFREHLLGAKSFAKHPSDASWAIRSLRIGTRLDQCSDERPLACSHSCELPCALDGGTTIDEFVLFRPLWGNSHWLQSLMVKSSVFSSLPQKQAHLRPKKVVPKCLLGVLDCMQSYA